MKNHHILWVAAVLSSQYNLPQWGAKAKVWIGVTGSIFSSGLLSFILPHFAKDSGLHYEIVTVAKGTALELAERGGADAVIINASSLEESFMHKGFGLERRPLMFNNFVIVGPVRDPARIAQESTVKDAFAAIARSEARFISRGDNSGTDKKEKQVWLSAGIDMRAAKRNLLWYAEVNGETAKAIDTADRLSGYTLCDRATWLSGAHKSSLRILFTKDDALKNHFDVITINPLRRPNANAEGAKILLEWLTSGMGRYWISEFKIGGDVAFIPFK